MQQKVKCWEFFECGQVECPAYKLREHRCWLISGSHCRDEIQGRFLEKTDVRLDCELFQSNLDLTSLEQTLKVVD
ncbi:MAG: hypothetical protein PVJ62_02470 [Deltaproteobacteria bacterium]|jgi:hypothetical protein